MIVRRRQHERPQSRPAALRIYEAHVGMSSEEPAVASYTYFKGGNDRQGGLQQRHCLKANHCHLIPPQDRV